ncbi:SusD/RagB family nutrient-binding outer membrane lipoprotein [Limibacter armeniacum]|uniref:SusD/RagB family nutrient-binding outer membrane lipoprotein n=1 Tax=Limibacter armeniacum TaxID=466084 RepID=UPI002FE5AF6D
MKKINKLLFVFALATSTMFGGCDSFVEGYEDDPTRPLSVGMDVTLSSAQSYTIYVQSDDIARFTAIVMQQVTGADRQFLAAQRYNIQRGDFDTPWSFNGYSGAMQDLKNLMIQAEGQSSPHYSGVAKVLMAVNLGVLTDAFGDIPYSEAFQGVENLKPKFDSQESIYTEIQSLLDGAIADLKKESVLSPAADDLIYGGDLAKWEMFAYGLKARYLNHLSKLSQYDANAVLSALSKSFATNEDDAQFVFMSSTLQSNPWNQFLVQREGYIALEGYMYDMMAEKADPRAPLYGEGGFYFQATSPIPMMTYVEAKFIEAEALLSQGKTVEAETAFQAAVRANMEKVGVDTADIETYMTAHGSFTAGTELEQLMEEKYVAMFTHPESWVDWRRSGVPSIVAPANSELSGGQIPRRFPYAESEYLYNSQNVPELDKEAGLTQRMWWDK